MFISVSLCFSESRMSLGQHCICSFSISITHTSVTISNPTMLGISIGRHQYWQFIKENKYPKIPRTNYRFSILGSQKSFIRLYKQPLILKNNLLLTRKKSIFYNSFHKIFEFDFFLQQNLFFKNSIFIKFDRRFWRSRNPNL